MLAGKVGYNQTVMRIARFVSPMVAALVILFLGCHHAATAYVLHRDGLDPILLPPTRGDNASQTLSVAIKGARQVTPKIDCDIVGDLMSLRWQGNAADVSFYSQAFFATSADQSPN